MAEARTLPALDGWLNGLFDLTTSTKRWRPLGRRYEPSELRGARLKLIDADAKLGQHLKALEHGVDAALLAHADPATNRQLYAVAGVALCYERRPEGELITASLGVEFLRVGGGTCSKGTRGTPDRAPSGGLGIMLPSL